MTILLLLFFVICCIDLKMADTGQYFDDYLSIKKTNAIKGIFVILVFFRHLTQYLTLDGTYDAWFGYFNEALKQLLVTMFLFYSGYGVMEAIKSKGMSYVKRIPIQRALKVLVHFDIAVVLYLIAAYFMGRTFPIRRILLSFIGWGTVGNSNWYIVAIIVTYIATAISFFIFRKNKYIAAVCCTMLCILYIVFIMPHKPSRYYNTILCYAMGMWYSLLFKGHIEKTVTKNAGIYWGCLAVLLLAFYYLGFKNWNNWCYEAWAILFTLIVVLATMKLQFDNSFLQLMGTHTFSIYILQRLPMNVLSKYFEVETHPYIFFVLAFCATIVISIVFDYLISKLDGFLFVKKKNIVIEM